MLQVRTNCEANKETNTTRLCDDDYLLFLHTRKQGQNDAAATSLSSNAQNRTADWQIATKIQAIFLGDGQALTKYVHLTLIIYERLLQKNRLMTTPNEVTETSG